MSIDGQPKPLPHSVKDWPGREQGVPQPPSPEQVDEMSLQQGLISDEWAPESLPAPEDNANYGNDY